jgi:N6-adenosine-specific RNA methylase IME4
MVDLWAGMRPPYRTIVADPPWAYAEGFPTQSRHDGVNNDPVRVVPLPYSSLAVEDIAALPVRDLADTDARLFLWTTNRYLPAAFTIAVAWGFRYRQCLVWHKADGNMGGSVAPNSAEFLLVCVRGTPPLTSKARSAVLTTAHAPSHSMKPPQYLDLIESVSPGPYVELFARQGRLGWDAWGLGHEANVMAGRG